MMAGSPEVNWCGRHSFVSLPLISLRKTELCPWPAAAVQPTVIDEGLFTGEDSDTSEHADTAPDTAPEPEEQRGPAAWEIETARIRAEQARKLAAKSEAAAAADSPTEVRRSTLPPCPVSCAI